MMREQLDIHRQKVNLNLYLIPYIKINSMNHRFKCKMIELVEENTGENLQDLGPGEEFLDMTPNT